MIYFLDYTDQKLVSVGRWRWQKYLLAGYLDAPRLPVVYVVIVSECVFVLFV